MSSMVIFYVITCGLLVQQASLFENNSQKQLTENISTFEDDETRSFENNKKRIVGGINTMQHEFPWQIAIVWKIGISKGDHICGGSLIDKQYVLTAAHCFVNGAFPRYYIIILGDHFKNVDHTHEQIKNIQKIIIHPKYDQSTYNNDIAIVKLKSPVRINNYVNPIALPTFIDFEIPGLTCTITGWGHQGKKFKNKGSNALKKADIQIISFSQCDHSRSYQGRITGNMFCAGHTDGLIDSCQGDSGGPLQCMRKGKWVLNGITSWGDGCGVKHKYGVYTVVRHYLTWIKSISNVLPPIPTKTPLIPPVPTKTPLIPPIPPIPPIPTQTPLIPPIPSQAPTIPPIPPIPPIPDSKNTTSTNTTILNENTNMSNSTNLSNSSTPIDCITMKNTTVVK